MTLELILNLLCEEDLDVGGSCLDGIVYFDKAVVLFFGRLVKPVNVELVQETVVPEHFLYERVVIVEDLFVLRGAPCISTNV